MAKNIKTLTINNEAYTMRPYGVCSTAAGTAAKSVTCAGFTLVAGATILVKFTYTNSVASATLNVNTTGAKPIRYNAAATTSSTRWPAGSIVEFFYDGTYWQVLSMQLPLATSTENGLISTGTQTIAGAKTFSGNTSITGTLTVGTAAATKETTLNGSLSVLGNIVQTGGNLILDSNDKKTDSSGATTGYGATPRLVFRRGGTTDSYNDWDMWGNSEGNFFLRKGTSSTGAENTWKNIMVAKDAEVAFSNTVKATTFVGDLNGNADTATTATTATKLKTARTIGIDTGAVGTATSFDGSANITIPITSLKESYLTWGGKHLKASLSPVDAAMTFGAANRFSFIPASKITIEYSTNGGTSWLPYDSTDAEKINSFTYTNTITWKRIGKLPSAYSSSNPPTASHMLRYTINTETPNLYANLSKFLIYVSVTGSSGCYCTVSGKTKYNSEQGIETWTTLANKVSIDGWSGWNAINISKITTYGHSGSKSSQYSHLRFTFGITSHTNTGGGGLQVGRIFAYGDIAYNSPSTLADKGIVYNYDYQQNVIFPGAIKLTKTESGETSTFTLGLSTGSLSFGSTTDLELVPDTDGTGDIGIANKYWNALRTNNIYTTNISYSTSTASSDERYKDFIEDITVDFNKLKAIPKKKFIWKEGRFFDNSKIHLGTSAQKLKEIYPELVNIFNHDECKDINDEKAILGVDYEKLSIVALAAIDKLNERLEILEQDNKNLKAENAKLQDRITRLENKCVDYEENLIDLNYAINKK